MKKVFMIIAVALLTVGMSANEMPDMADYGGGCTVSGGGYTTVVMYGNGTAWYQQTEDATGVITTGTTTEYVGRAMCGGSGKDWQKKLHASIESSDYADIASSEDGGWLIDEVITNEEFNTTLLFIGGGTGACVVSSGNTVTTVWWGKGKGIYAVYNTDTGETTEYRTSEYAAMTMCGQFRNYD